MILDARSVEAGSLAQYDLCIVGAGPAGLTVALELADTGARICVLEAGGPRYDRNAQDLLGGVVESEQYPPLRDTRYSGLGGSTRLWGGWCRPLDDIDFERRHWVPDSGWPFGRSELDPFYRRAHDLLDLGDYEYEPNPWVERGMGERLLRDGDDLVASVFQVNSENFGSRHHRSLSSAANVHVVLHAVVCRLTITEGREEVRSVEVATANGRQLSVHARFVVLAAGGIENARLLMLSNAGASRKLGNQSGCLGRFFTDHVFLSPGSYVPDRPDRSLRFYFPTSVASLANGGAAPGSGASIRGAFSLARQKLERDELLNGALFFHSAYESHDVFRTEEVQALLAFWEATRGRGVPGHAFADLRRALRSPHRVAHAIARKLFVSGDHAARWRIRAFFECESRPSNAISLSGPRDTFDRPLPEIAWSVSELDLRSIRMAWKTLDAELRKAQRGHLELDFSDEDEAWREACFGGKHHMGTTRLHPNPGKGVVDSDARVHGSTNLYITGSSVFPTGGYANPTLTIVALAARLGSHLKDRLSGDV